MGALSRPDLPPGALRDLNHALHELHHTAGWPSLRTLAKAAGCSPTTVSKVFTSPALPSWGTLELLVEELGGDTTLFHHLWLAASTPTHGTTPAAPRIAGRRAELAAVRRHLETGTGLLLITGEAGIGKTTLLTAATAETDVHVAVGHCLPLSSEVPMLPLGDCLRAVADADSGWLASALGSCSPYVPASLATLVPEVADGTLGTTGTSHDRQLLFTAYATVLRALCERRRLALLIEDLHWADPATLDLLEHLLARTATPIVGTWRSRDETTPPVSLDWLTRIRRLPTVTVLELGALSRAETVEQLRLLGHGAADRAERIYERTQGLPLFTVHLAAHEDGESGLPSLLADVLEGRLEGLTEGAWTVVCALGSAERPLSASTLAGATDLAPHQLTIALRELRSRGLLRDTASDAAELHHPLLAEAVNRRMVPGERSEMHRALAVALGALQSVEPAEVAEHWRRAGDDERECAWRITAARQAAACFDQRQAADQWLRALEVWPVPASTVGAPPITRADAYLAGMEALRLSFQFERGRDMSERAETVLGPVPEAVRAELLMRAAEYRGLTDDAQVGNDLLDEALRLFDRLPPTPAKVRALDRKLFKLWDLGQHAASRAVLASALAVAEEIGEASMVRDLLMQEAWLVGLDGDLARAEALMAGAATRAGTTDDPLGDLRRAVYHTDMLRLCGGGADRVRTVAVPALEQAQALGIDNLQALMLRGNLAAALLRAGRVAEAVELLDVAADDAVDLGRFWPHAVRAAIDVALGDLARAQARLDAIATGFPAHVDWASEILMIAADAACWAGDPHPALEDLMHRLDVLSGAAPVRVVAPGLQLAARGAADLRGVRDSSPRGAEVMSVRALLERSGLLDPEHLRDRFLTVQRQTTLAELERHDSRDRPDAWSQAAALWDLFGRPHDAGYCRWRGAQAALRDGQGTLAARLLKRAAVDAREHVPLTDAIAKTRAGLS